MIINALKKCAMFSGLSDLDLMRLAKFCREKKYSKNELIFSQRDDAKGFYLIDSGEVRIFQLSESGKENLLHVFGDGETFGEAVAIVGKRFPANAETISKSNLVYIPAREFSEFLEKNPRASKNIISSLATLVHMFVERLESITLKNAQSRVAAYILSLAPDNRHTSALKFPVKKKVLAQILNIKQETLSRIFSALATKKLIAISGNSVKIVDFKGLKTISEKDEDLI